MLPVFCRLALARSTSTLTLAVYLPFSTFSISFLADLVSASTSTVGLPSPFSISFDHRFAAVRTSSSVASSARLMPSEILLVSGSQSTVTYTSAIETTVNTSLPLCRLPFRLTLRAVRS